MTGYVYVFTVEERQERIRSAIYFSRSRRLVLVPLHTFLRSFPKAGKVEGQV